MPATQTSEITQTKHFSLDLPPYGATDWHIFVNLNFKKIDEYIQQNLEHSQISVASENGPHGLRYWNGKLEFTMDKGETWFTIVDVNRPVKTAIVSSLMPHNQRAGDYWYEVENGTIEEDDYLDSIIPVHGSNVLVINNVDVSDIEPLARDTDHLWFDTKIINIRGEENNL